MSAVMLKLIKPTCSFLSYHLHRPKPKEPVYATREEELEARVRELELENAILKRINALADEIERKQRRR